MRQSIEKLVKNRIIDHGRGWSFTPMHFSDLCNDPSIRKPRWREMERHCRPQKQID